MSTHAVVTDKVFLVLGMINAAGSISYNDLAKILPIPTVVLDVGNTTLCTALIAGRLAYVSLTSLGYACLY